jgi:hypothetical protein
MTIVSFPRFYVYTLARPDGSVFYVGNGTGERRYQHAWKARAGEQSAKADVLRDLFAQGQKPIISIVHRAHTKIEVQQVEAALITKYGLDQLTNVYPGCVDRTPPRSDDEVDMIVAAWIQDLAA